MTSKHCEQDAVVRTPSNQASTVRRGPCVCPQILLLGLIVAAIGCSNPEPENERSGRAVDVVETHQALFTNGDFESGTSGFMTPPGWTLSAYYNPGVTRQTPQTRAGLNLTSGGSLQANTLYTAGGAESQPDDELGSAASLRWPKYGNRAVYLNSNPGSSNNVNSIKQTMTLGVNDVDPYDGRPHIRFAVAPVLENPGHSAEEQPYYFVQVRNVTTNTVLYVDYNASAEPGIPWKTENGIYYTDWQLKDIAPTSVQATLGDSIELEVIAAGCSQGGHYGRVYVDGVGPSIPGLSVTGSAPASANAGSDITYTLAFKNGGTGTAGNVTVEFNTPPDTTFQSVSAAGAICSTPSVGSAGLVSCVFGLLDPGDSDSLDLTVKIAPSATGTITAGNYQISANNASKLLGSKLYTTVTNSVSYADVGVTISNGVGAVNWNQALTYNIVATNNGPATITGGTVTNTMPAELTSVTWTCSGASGGSCAASGSGNIADSTVGLPPGGSVTYVVTATMAASGGATRVVNTASFTMPAGVSDPQPSDNAAADTDNITNTYTLVINKAGSSTGNVVSVPGAIQCDDQCASQSATFAAGAVMILAATPTPGKVFTGWSGGTCSGTANCSITLNANASVTATFDDPPPCSMDSDCSSSRFCDGATQTCKRRLPNGSPIPSDTIHLGTCATSGTVCVSGLCNPNTNKCAQSCTADSNCTNDSYCDNSVMYCVTKLPSGSAIPNDGLHGGTCTNAADVCQTGTCNTAAVTCGDSNGSSCSANSGCVSNSCKSSHCVPASNGCYADTDCSSTQYCNRGTLTCVNKLNAGAAIPNDTLHTGTCSDATAVCSSSLCNSTTNTCAAANGASCSLANQCSTNTCTSTHCVPASNGCWVDANCGSGDFCDRSTFTCTAKLAAGTSIPNDGLHTNICTNAGAVCSSGLCNSTQITCGQNNGAACTDGDECVNNTCTSGFCVPASNGCYLDTDCGTGQYCNRGTLTCAAKLASGTLIPNDGLHGGTCSDADAVCLTGLCDTNTSRCVSSDGATCSNANQCVSATCTSGHCVPDTNGCWLDGDCGTGTFCDRGALTCASKLMAGTMIPATDGYHAGTCMDAGAVCASGQCNSTTTTCSSPVVTSCTMASECTSNVCATNGQCGTMDGGSGCTSGNAATVCQSSTCASGHCVPSGGSGCWIDSDCAGNQYCDRDTLLCQTKLSSGTAIPNDGLHDGRCTQNNAQAVCASGGCNPITNTCGGTNGATCAAPEDCIRNICGGNAKCGYENGVGPCTQVNAKFVCQSATCSATAGVCVAPSTQTCASDDDCTAQQYCDALNAVCVPDLPNGTAIPTDVLHTGLCTTNVGSKVCASGTCNASTHTCAAAVGGNCSTGADCAGNVCGSNNKCGGAPGDAGCTQANQAATCQSGACSQNGTCLETGKCAVDGDCSAGNYCSGTSKTCIAALPAGSPLPSDGDHDGTCPGSGLSAACATGRCSTQTDRCVAPNGTSCSDANECETGNCGGNGLCGIEDGDGPCTPGADSSCQSGSCDGSNTCSSATACSLDSECSGAGGFCNDGLCAPKLAAGTPIPNDSLHAATCNPTNASAVCVSGLCNGTSNTCAAARSMTCAIASQCASNVCGANGACGRPNGTGPCTSGNAATICQSGVCSNANSTCVPSGGCASDDECMSNEYCDGEQYTCAPKLTAGSPIPSDGIHDGNCNEQTAALCASGECNPVTDTCALPNGDDCASAIDCASNVCSGDGKCGRADGEGPCVPALPAVCRSATCSPTTLICIPGGGCASDNDCQNDQYCDTTNHQCQTRVQNGDGVPASVGGGDCPDSGFTRSCASGLCDTTTDACVAPNGADCTGASECQSGMCGSNGKCGIEDGGTCTIGDDAQCQSGNCNSQSECEPAAACSDDTDCAPAGYCDGSVCHALLTPGSPLPDDGLHDGQCDEALAQLVCSTGRCNETTNTCAGEFNVPCATGDQCEANVCGSDGKCGLPIGEGTCNNLNAAIRCRTQLCSAAGVCLPELASGCAVDADCSTNQFCKRDTYECMTKLTEGSPIPDDGLHDGTCTDESAAQVCATAACNPAADTCASANGTACSDANTCVTNVCGSNGQCGIAEGDSGCTAETASICQTGRCSPSTGKCINQTQGCAADADCENARYCSPNTRTCVTKLAPGGKLPSDSLHDGDCNDSLAAAVCDSAACNPTTDTCATANGANCSEAAECVSNACGNNQKCGRAIGQSGCSVATQTLDCQSGYCSPSGACVPPAGCDVDSDCSEDSYCNRTAHACAPKLTEGSPLPSDGLHDGQCDEELAQHVCSSGHCNPVTNTCALTSAGTCTLAEQCTTGLCSANDKCGIENGSGPCAQDAECQSGKCQLETEKCVAAGAGCTEDTDCPDEQHCDRTNVVCVDDLGDGAGIPSDSTSGGKCSVSVAAIVCASGACNPDNDTCAKPGGAECETDDQCAASGCNDGTCGSPDASGSCSEENASIACQSGECQTDLGRCVAASDGCKSDGDCSSGQYCDATRLRCADKLDSGKKLPADGMHSAQCSSEIARAVCSTGLCNKRTDRCALPVGETCNSAGECGSNACLKNVCVPTSEAPPAAKLDGGRCSVLYVGQTSDPLWSILVLGTAVGFVARLARRRSQKRRER